MRDRFPWLTCFWHSVFTISEALRIEDYLDYCPLRKEIKAAKKRVRNETCPFCCQQHYWNSSQESAEEEKKLRAANQVRVAYKCLCGVFFNTKAQVSSHLVLHTLKTGGIVKLVERQNICLVCRQEVAPGQAMVEHNRQHEKCPFCPKRHSWTQHHALEHYKSAKLRYKCPRCNKRLSAKCLTRRHFDPADLACDRPRVLTRAHENFFAHFLAYWTRNDDDATDQREEIADDCLAPYWRFKKDSEKKASETPELDWETCDYSSYMPHAELAQCWHDFWHPFAACADANKDYFLELHDPAWRKLWAYYKGWFWSRRSMHRLWKWWLSIRPETFFGYYSCYLCSFRHEPCKKRTNDCRRCRLNKFVRMQDLCDHMYNVHRFVPSDDDIVLFGHDWGLDETLYSRATRAPGRILHQLYYIVFG